MKSKLSNHIPLIYPGGAHMTVVGQGQETILAISTALGQHKAVSQLTMTAQARAALCSALVDWRCPLYVVPQTAELVLLAVSDLGHVALGSWTGNGWRVYPTNEEIINKVYAWAPLPKRPDPAEVLP